jgi:hypothetical protein
LLAGPTRARAGEGLVDMDAACCVGRRIGAWGAGVLLDHRFLARRVRAVARPRSG